MRLHDHTTHTRFVLEVSAGEPNFKLRSFADPYRLAVDVPDLQWAVADQPATPVGLVSRVQYNRKDLLKPILCWIWRVRPGCAVVRLAGNGNHAHAFGLGSGADYAQERFLADAGGAVAPRSDI